MKDLGIISVSYNQNYPLKTLINSFKSQTLQNFDLHIVHDGEWDNEIKNSLYEEKYTTDNIFLHNTKTRYNDYGHSLRDWGIKKFHKDYKYFLITNSDNYYCPKFVEQLFSQIDDNTGIVYFNMVHSHDQGFGTYSTLNTDFIGYRCDIGSFIVRSDIAYDVGFNRRDFNADAFFINEINEYRKVYKIFDIKKIDKYLMTHN
jgi:hypothetical protein